MLVEPRHGQQHLGGRVGLQLPVAVARHRLEHLLDDRVGTPPGPVRLRPRNFGTGSAAPNQVDPVVAAVPGDRIDQIQLLHPAPETGEVVPQLFQRLHAVAQGGRVLEPQLPRRRLHGSGEFLEGRAGAGLEEGAGQAEAAVIFGRRAAPGAGRETGSRIGAHAPGHLAVREDLELVAEVDRGVARTVPQSGRQGQVVHGTPEPAGPAERTVVGRSVVADPGDGDQARGRFPRDLDEPVPAVAPVLHVVLGLP